MQPREFQIFIIYCMVFLTNQMIYLIRKTGEGKSLAFLATAVMLWGVIVVMFPLIGLGSDQVNKAMKLEYPMEFMLTRLYDCFFDSIVQVGALELCHC